MFIFFGWVQLICREEIKLEPSIVHCPGVRQKREGPVHSSIQARRAPTLWNSVTKVSKMCTFACCDGRSGKFTVRKGPSRGRRAVRIGESRFIQQGE